VSYYYPKHDPKWNRADSVAFSDETHTAVDVTIWQGTEHEKTFRNCEISNHNKFGVTTNSDVIVEDGAFGWWCIWFTNAEVKPFVSESEAPHAN